MADLQSIAAELLAAYGAGRPTVAPLTGRYSDLTLDDAYQIQMAQIRQRLTAGAEIIGYKVGLTSAAMQQQMGVFEPDFGHLLTDMLHPSDAPIAIGPFKQPRAEPEIALILGQDLPGPGLSVADVISATAYTLPAIEIIDSRIADWKIGLIDTIADNASSAGLVLGQTPASPSSGRDLALAGCVFRRNGRIAGTGAGAAVLGSPWNAATWLANTLTARGAHLRAGSIILTGSIIAAVPVASGDAVMVTIDGLGSTTAVFE